METSLRFFFCGFLLILCITETFPQCDMNPTLRKDDKQTGGHREALLQKLNDLPADLRNKGLQQKVGEKTYEMKICPDDGKVHDNSGLAEIDNGKTTILGRTNESDVHVSTYGDWIMLIYTNGDDYNNACNRSERRTLVLIRPDPAMNLSQPSLLKINEAVGDKEDFCFYQFELLVPEIFGISSILNYKYYPSTPATSSTSGKVPESPSSPSAKSGGSTTGNSAVDPAHGPSLSAGSIILILTVVPVLVFFAVGSIYKRFVVGAQGWEQVPFIDFWRRCGSLQSDGCRYLFGRGRARGGSHYDDYTAVNSEEERQPLGDQNNNNDDHLLPM